MFVPLPLLIVAVAVVVALLVFALRPRGRSNDLIAPPRRPLTSSPHRTPTVPPGTVPGLPPEVEAQIWELLRADQVITAIKVARQATGLGLREAKDLVEGMRRSGPPEH